MPTKPLPPRLYKYQPFNAQTLANIHEQAIWFSAPIKFNDPYDCALSVVEFDKISEPNFQRALDYARGRDPALAARMCPDGVPTSKFREAVVGSIRRTYAERLVIQREQRGIACFSAHVTDLMMWSHYADGHRGFCLEFDTSLPPFSRALEVNYSDSVPTIDPIDVLVEKYREADGNELLKAFVLTKALCWSYEREWRLIHEEPNKQYGYGDGPLTGVYFGTAMPAAHKGIICLMLRDTRVQFHEMLRDDRSFSLTPRVGTYRPFPHGERGAAPGSSAAESKSNPARPISG